MSHRSDKRILVAPEELVVDSPELGKVYVESLRLTNTLSAPVDLSFKLPNNPDRVYEILPQALRIPGNEEARVELRFKVLKPIPKIKTVRDVVNIKAEYFEQQFVITYKAGRDRQTVTIVGREKKKAEDLEAEIRELRAGLEQKDEDLNQAEAKIAGLEHELQSLRLEVSARKDDAEEIHRLKTEVQELTERLEDTAQLSDYFNQVKAMLAERMPNVDELIELSVRQEKQRHERISTKALMMLKEKDGEISELKDRVEEQQNTIALLQQKLTDSRVLISNTEKSLKATNKNVEELKMTVYDKERQIQEMEAEMESLRGLANRSETDDFEKQEIEVHSNTRIEELQAAIHHLESELKQKTAACESVQSALDRSEAEAKVLKQKEQYVLELSSRQTKLQQENERTLRDKERVIGELSAKVNTQTEHIQSLLSQFSQQRDSDVISRVMKLEEENRHLQLQLAESRNSSHNPSSRSMKEEDLRPSGPSVKRVQVLEEENSKLTKSLRDSQLEFSRMRQELEETLAGKNRELLEMQQKLIHLQEKVAEMRTPERLARTQVQDQSLSEENAKLRQTLQVYEQKNAELTSENELLAKRADMEHPMAGEGVVVQTQLISRLNARISSMKAREERILEALKLAENAVQEKDQLIESERSMWQQEKASLLESRSPTKSEAANAVVQTERNAWAEESARPQEDSLEGVWTNAMIARYEKRIAEIDKDATSYQMKHYAALKETHDLKEKLARRISEDIENQTKWERDNVQIQVKCESLKEQVDDLSLRLQAQSEELAQERAKVVSLRSEIDTIKQESAKSSASRESTILQLSSQRESLQSELKERTAQIAILMETLVAVQDGESTDAVAKKCADLAVHLSNEQAVISNLELRVGDLKAVLQGKMKEIADLEKEKSGVAIRAAELEAKTAALIQQHEALSRQLLELKQDSVARSHDNQALQSQVRRLQDDLADAKAKFSLTANQLTESERRSSQVLAKERREFKEALLTARDAPLQVFDVSQPVVLALKQLTVALNAVSDRAPSPDFFLQLVKDMGELVVNCDKALIMSEAKVRRLEFLTQSEVYFKYLDPATLEMTYAMLDRQEILANELKRLKKPQQTNMQEVYRRRTEELENVLKARNEALRTTEIEKAQNAHLANALKERVQLLETKLNAVLADKDAFEVLSLARAEEELKAKSRIRDEGVKTYIDGVITRAALNSSEASKLLTLSREIASLKLINDDLVSELSTRSKERDMLYLANESQRAALDDLERPKPDFKAEDGPNVQLRTKCDQLSRTVFDLRRELESYKEKVEEIEQQLATGQMGERLREEAPVAASAKEEELRNELLELKEQHKLELDSLRTDCNLKMQTFKRELETEYSHALEQFKDGEFPGEYKRRAEDLERKLNDMAGEHVAMEDMLVQAKAVSGNLQQANAQMREELDLARSILSDLQNPLIAASVDAPPSPRRGSVSSKKNLSKKQLSLDRSDRPSVALPQKLVKALVSAKIGEAEATKKLRSAGKLHTELRESAIKKDARIRDLEARVKTLESIVKRKGGDTSSVSSVDDREYEPLVTLKSRIAELEQENDELRLAEASNWAAYSPLMVPQEDMSVSEVPRDDFALLVEGIVYLTQHLDQEQTSPPATVEQSQRLVIRALSRTVAMLSKEPLAGLIDYKPSKAEDRQVWYLELAEQQLNSVHETIRKLVDFTNKVSVEITGSFAGSAQYKGASLELAKCTKETAEELETMRQLCILVRRDMETMRRPGSPRDSDEFAYRDRATLAEDMKRRLEEEVVNLRMEHSFAVQKLESQLADLSDSKKRTAMQLEIAEGERVRANGLLEETKARVIQTELALEREREMSAQMKAQIADMAAVKQDAGRQVDKFQRELRQWQAEHSEKLRGKDEIIAELQKQVKGLSEERAKQDQLVTKLKAKTVKRGEEDDQLDVKRKLSILAEEKKLDDARNAKEREAVEAKVNQLETALKEFKAQIQAKDAEIESLQVELKRATKSATRPPRQKDVSKQADLELEIHSQAIEIMNMKNEHESEVLKLQTLLSDTQRQLRDKVEATDAEVRKRLEAEGRMKEVQEERRTAERRLKEVAENTAVETQEWRDEMERAEKELKRLRAEKEELISALHEKTNGADNLAQLILQTEKERKISESELRIEKERLSEALSFEKAQQSALSAEVKTLKSTLQSLEATLRSSQSRETELQDMLETKEQSLSELRKEILAFAEKQKTWEDTFESLKRAKEESERTLNDQIKDLRAEMARQFESYSKNLEMCEGQLTALKDICAEEQRAKRGVKKGAETVDYFLQIAKKDAVINSLKAELKESKRKQAKKAADDEPEQPQVYKLKTKVHTLKAQLTQERDNIARLQDLLEKYDTSHEEAKEKESTFRKEVSDLERKYKSETQRLAEEVTKIREKWHSPEEWGNMLANVKELESAHKRAMEELKRKSEVLETLRSAKEQHDSEANALQDELENIKDIAEQVKKLKSEVLRKDKALADMKAALDQMRETDKRLGEENAVLNERLRTAVADVKRKDTMLRDVRAKMESVGGDVEAGRAAGEQCERLKDQVKRQKQEVERKDAAMKLLKAKLDTAEQEIEKIKSNMHQTSTDAFTSLESEIGKNKVLDANLKRSEAQLQALYLITKRIFRELVKSVESLKMRVQEEGFDREMYSDCMDILRLSEAELQEFVGQGRNSTSGVLEQIDRLLEERSVNVNEVIELFEKLLEERAQLERSSSDVASKYQDYIRRMQQEVTQERETYEQKIKDLEASIKRKRKS